jgi:transketolase
MKKEIRTMDNKKLQDIVSQTRRDILRMVHKVNSGHPGGSLGCTEFFVALYNVILDLKEGFDMDGKEEDLFFLSNGHISPVFYSVLAHRGYFPVKELSTFRLLNSRKVIQQHMKDCLEYEFHRAHWVKDCPLRWVQHRLKN